MKRTRVHCGENVGLVGRLSPWPFTREVEIVSWCRKPAGDNQTDVTTQQKGIWSRERAVGVALHTTVITAEEEADLCPMGFPLLTTGPDLMENFYVLPFAFFSGPFSVPVFYRRQALIAAGDSIALHRIQTVQFRSNSSQGEGFTSDWAIMKQNIPLSSATTPPEKNMASYVPRACEKR